MADYEVRDADIWVGGTAPTGADPDDFWFDTSKVPLFGITILGTLDVPGPPAVGGAAGDAWWDPDGNLWVSDGVGGWTDQGSFRGPVGPTGPEGPGMAFKGPLGSPAELPTGAAAGDAYVIAPDLFMWDGSSWVTSPWVGPAGPTGPAGPVGPAGPGLMILGTLPDAGPPVDAGTAAGDTWISSDGDLWVWDGDQWSKVVVSGGSGDVAALTARVEALEALISPSLAAWIATADWSPDGEPVPDPVLPVSRSTGRMVRSSSRKVG